MKAKEMFEKLGYELMTNNERRISYYTQKGISQGYRILTFDKKREKIVPYNRVQIDMDLIKAINKQIEELHWNE